MERELIPQEHFEAWLMAQPRDRVIESGNVNDCFICSFLKETGRTKTPFMTYDNALIDGHKFSLPQWIKSLINFDQLKYIAIAGKRNSPVTAGDMQDRYNRIFPSAMPTKTMEVEGLLEPKDLVES